MSKIELKDNQFLYEKSLITINSFATKEDSHLWVLAASGAVAPVSQATVKQLNPELYKAINKEVGKFQVKQTKILKEREDKQQQIDMAAKVEKIKAFVTQVTDIAIEDFWNLEPKFKKVNEHNYSSTYDDYNISFSAARSVTLTYEPKRDVGHYRTRYVDSNQPWVVEVSYKKRRYKKFTSAMKRIMDIVNERNEVKTAEQLKQHTLQVFANKTNTTVVKDWVSYGRTYSRGGYYRLSLVPTKEANDSTPSLKISIQYHDGKVTATGAKLYQETKILGFEAVQRTTISLKLETAKEVKAFIKKVQQAMVVEA